MFPWARNASESAAPELIQKMERLFGLQRGPLYLSALSEYASTIDNLQRVLSQCCNCSSAGNCGTSIGAYQHTEEGIDAEGLRTGHCWKRSLANTLNHRAAYDHLPRVDRLRYTAPRSVPLALQHPVFPL